jgi:membrane complex biogenesis BtpA family protein
MRAAVFQSAWYDRLLAHTVWSYGMTNFQRIFGDKKPVIAMVHFLALPGTPLYEEKGGIEQIVEGARKDLQALIAAGVDAVMFGNENDRPYELNVDMASTATMAYVIGRLRPLVTIPFGVNVLWDPMSSIALAVATGASFIREICTGYYASDMGPWAGRSAEPMRYRNRLGRKDIAMLYNLSAEFAHSLDQRPLSDRARSAAFSSIPDAVLVSGVITGEAPPVEQLESVKRVLPGTPVLANTGVRHETVADVLRVADGCIVGSSLKVDGYTWNSVDPERAKEFMRLVNLAR